MSLLMASCQEEDSGATRMYTLRAWHGIIHHSLYLNLTVMYMSVTPAPPSLNPSGWLL